MQRTAFLRTALILSLLLACGREEKATPAALFEDRAVSAGLDFVHFNGMSGEYYFSEIVGAGAALADFDGDGDLDAYLVQGAMLGDGKALEEALLPFVGQPPPRDRLFLNQLVESGELSFLDGTEASGIQATGYGMGVATGDFDNDGRVDLYLSQHGENQLWHNQGLGPSGGPIFREVSREAGAGDARWSTSAAFLDFDADGWLDLFVVNYTDFRIANNSPCFNEMGAREFCGPKTYRPETDRLFRNLGPGEDGQVRFEEISGPAGLEAMPGPGLGVVSGDFDGDGRLDIYVANDQARNHLWMQGSGDGLLFAEEALLRGNAVDGQGNAQASMGVDSGDLDNDGDPDLFMTHLLNEVNTLYLNDGQGFFQDQTNSSGLGAPSIGYTGFGTAMLDVNGDGWLDVITVNGAVRTVDEQRRAGNPLPLEQPNQLFLNREGHFEEASAQAPVLARPLVSRGVAVGDVDNNGSPDLLVTNNGGPAQLLINQVDLDQAWLGLAVEMPCPRDSASEEGRVPCRRPALGAVVTLLRPEGDLRRRVRSDSSYLVARDPRVLFPLTTGKGGLVEVLWPDGVKELFGPLEGGRYHRLVKGQGKAAGERGG